MERQETIILFARRMDADDGEKKIKTYTYILYYSNIPGSGIRPIFIRPQTNDEAYAYAREYKENQLNSRRIVLHRFCCYNCGI